MTEQEKYLHLYESDAQFQNDYTGTTYHEDWVSLTVETHEVHYNKEEIFMTLAELIEAGYAEIKQDYAASSNDHAETGWSVIQIHQACPVKLENITDFDDYLPSATTYVWREALPNGWSASDLAAKYDGVQLARPPMEEMFWGVDMGSVSALTLSFAPASWYVCDTSILTQRYKAGGTYANTPENVTITIRSGADYSSVFQTSLSKFVTTKHLTFNCGQGWGCHDVTGMFENNPELTGLTFTGRWYGYLSRWDGGMMGMMYMFEGDSKLIEVPLLNADLARDHEYNMFYPHFYSNWARGTHSITGMFKGCTALTSIKPTFNMLATRTTASEQAFQCPNLTDVHFKNLNNSNWDFTSADYYIPRMSVESIQYLINNLSTQQASAQGHLLYWTDSSKTGTTETDTGLPAENNFTITFSDLHQSEIAQSYIDAAAAKGWTIAFTHVNL